MVVSHLHQGLAVLVEQMAHRAVVLDPGHGQQVPAASGSAHERGQLGRDVTRFTGGQRQLNLCPGVLGRRAI